jgi:RHS repeat-associated protein
VSEALDGNGNVTAQQLFAPYGGVRYTSGVMPTAKAFTGQRTDAASGLDYFNARYYDPVLGQFASADSDGRGGLNRYGYVKGNPETATDPTGHNDCPHTANNGCMCKEDCTPPAPCKVNPGLPGCGGTQPPAGGGCTHNCAPGCKGTKAQCDGWSARKSAEENRTQLVMGMLQLGMGIWSLILDVMELFRGGLDGIEKLTAFVAVLADGLTLISGALNLAQALGWGNFAGLRQWVSGASAALDYITAGLRAIGREAGWWINPHSAPRNTHFSQYSMAPANPGYFWLRSCFAGIRCNKVRLLHGKSIFA